MLVKDGLIWIVCGVIIGCNIWIIYKYLWSFWWIYPDWSGTKKFYVFVTIFMNSFVIEWIDVGASSICIFSFANPKYTFFCGGIIYRIKEYKNGSFRLTDFQCPNMKIEFAFSKILVVGTYLQISSKFG